MDKLRALQYAVAAADSGSLSAAARRLDVSLAAVSKQIGALERTLGFRLFERGTGGLVPTGTGAAYLEACRDGLARLADAEEQGRSASSGLRGTVVVGVQPAVAQEVLCEALPLFRSLHPDINLDLRYFLQPVASQMDGVDVMLAIGWSVGVDDLVTRPIGAAGFVICAAPDYWDRRGVPAHPSELSAHDCLCIRSRSASVMDLWRFRRGDEEATVSVKDWLTADNGHRDSVVRMALAGQGVVRLLDWHARPGRELATGALQPVLTDWLPLDVPAMNLHYPPSARRIPRVRAFIDFAVRLFDAVDAQRALRLPSTTSPRWLLARRSRASRAP